MQEVIGGLTAALAHLERARERLGAGLREWLAAAETYQHTLAASRQPECHAVLRIVREFDAATVSRLHVELFTLKAGLKKLLRAYIGDTAPPVVQETHARRPVAPAVTNRHGTRYPHAAAGLVESLPPRLVPRSGFPTVGIPRIGGQVAPPVESGLDPELSEAVTRRLAELGIRSTFLPSHVEMKVAAKMIATGQRDVELAINNVPCGVEVQKAWADTCHKVLDRFLPPGFRLTVYGSTRDNRPWRRTYGTGGDQA